MTTIRHTLLVLAFTMPTLASQHTVQAASLHSAVGNIVERLCQYLNSKGETQISVGQFVGPPQIASTSGPGISKIFQEHFTNQGIKVASRANTGLKGEYFLTKTANEGVGVKIKGSLVDPFGDVLTDFSFDADGDGESDLPPGTVEDVVDKTEEVAQLLGTTTEVHPEDREVDRNRDLKDRILNPKLHINGTRCAASASSPYHIEIMVRGQGMPLRDDDGLGFVDLERGDIYAVRIHNESEYDAAVRMSIDGLNIFTFSELKEADGTPRYSYYIVPKQQTVELVGWHKNNDTVNSFKVTGYADSAAATIDHTNELGTITAVFSAAWPHDGPRPHDEEFTSKGSGNATGFGPPISQVVKEVRREVGSMRASISLRYSK